ncbi:MAG: cyclic pyranopterin monophosphate synthase MoaC [Dehalococcoidales bacterium]|jgi:cyclic pyranopterin phosphate synthase
MAGLTHLNAKGDARMVDVSAKDDTLRQAVASGRVKMKPATLEKIRKAALAKGDALALARVAGIMAAKKTSGLIPLCHNILISGTSLDFNFVSEDTIEIKATVSSRGQTGVEMEALVAVAVAALTIYDMAKAVDRDIIIEAVRLESKTGGKSGTYRREEG